MRRAARLPAVDVHRVVLDAGAEPDLPHHLHVIGGAHPQPLRLEQLALPVQLRQPLLQLGLDAGDRALHPLRPSGVVRGREDEQLVHLAHDVTGQRVQVVQLLHLVAEHLHPDREFLVRRDDLEGVTAHPERAAVEGHVVAGVLDVDQPPQQLVPLDLGADRELDRAVEVLLRRAQAIDRRHRRDHDHIAAGQQRHRGRVPQPLHLLVDGGVLLDVGVGLRDVRLGLVVVVVGDEVLHRVARHQLAELLGQLGGEGLVRRDDQGRPLQLLDEPGGGRALAGAGGAEQHDVRISAFHPDRQLLDRGRLVARGGVVVHHRKGAVQPRDVQAHAPKPTPNPRQDAGTARAGSINTESCQCLLKIMIVCATGAR